MIETGIVFGIATAFIPIALTISRRIGKSELELPNKNCLFRILGVSVALGAIATLLAIAAVLTENLDLIKCALIAIVLEVLMCSYTVADFLLRGSE